MAVPVLLVTGFLGAGKTTLVNRILADPGGRRIAALVNDFGAIDIDADLLEGASEGVLSLKNGCICCSLQGDLLRVLSTVLRRDPPPDAILIESSGVADPAEIVGALLDPVIWRAAALDAVICLADARHFSDSPALLQDALCRGQLAAADFVVLNKVDLATDAECEVLAEDIAAIAPRAVLVQVQDADVPPELLFSATVERTPAPAAPRASRPAAEAFDSLSWTSATPLSLARFQQAMGQLAPGLVRAKGFLLAQEQPGQRLLFQLAGRRATLGPAPDRAPAPDAEPVRLVLIGRIGAFDPERARALLEGCRAPPG